MSEKPSWITNRVARKIVTKFKFATECEKCEGSLFPSTAYCLSCGMKNPAFSEAEFKKETDNETIEKYLARECRKGHFGVRASMAKDADFADQMRRYPFCEVCGEKIG